MRSFNRASGLFRVFFFFVLLVIFAIWAVAGFSVLKGYQYGESVNWGVNGPVQTTCVGRYKFVTGADGSTRQVMDEHGQGIRCSR